MKYRFLIVIGVIIIILTILGIVTGFKDNARVRNGMEPIYVTKIVSQDGSKVTYFGIGYKVIRYPSISPNEPYENNVGVKYGSWFMKYDLPKDNSPKVIKINIFDRDEIIKVAIDNFSQFDNYFEYTDNDVIDKIYNLFTDLETVKESKGTEPESPEEIYKIIFFNDDNMLVESDNDIFKSIVYVFEKDDKYYVFEQNNGIYEVKEEVLNTIKDYTK